MTESDVKNLMLSSFSGVPAFLLAFDEKSVITILSAIVLPCFFFAVGKTADILLQLYLKKRETDKHK